MSKPTSNQATLSLLSRRNTLALIGVTSALAAFSSVSCAAHAPKKIAFIGAGRMGTAIGTLLVKAGYEVMFSSRHPENLKSLTDSLGSRAHAGTVAEAMKYGEVIILTLPYSGVPDLAKEHGKTLAGKPLVLDVGNAVPTRDGEIGELGRAKGAGLFLKELLPGAKIVRAFNAINWEKLPEYATRTGDKKVAAPILGEDKAAIAIAEKLIRDIGFEPVLVGGLELSNYTAPRTPFADDHTPDEVRKLTAELKKQLQ